MWLVGANDRIVDCSILSADYEDYEDYADDADLYKVDHISATKGLNPDKPASPPACKPTGWKRARKAYGSERNNKIQAPNYK